MISRVSILESIRQFQHEVGRNNSMLIHVTLIPYLSASQELKTKPTQASVKELQGMGLQPDVIMCRSDYPMGDQMKAKIGLFCNVPVSHVLENLNCDVLYEVPLMLEEEHLADVACECLVLIVQNLILTCGKLWWMHGRIRQAL